MKHLDLFSGIGGFALAASWVWGPEHEIVSFVEIDPFCQKVLKKHWPDVPIISDIRELNIETVLADTECRKTRSGNKQKSTKEKFMEIGASCNHGRAKERPTKTQTAPIDLLTGGFPCQPFSVAGKRGSKKDDRYLWPAMLDVIQKIRPTWIIGENVAGIINLALDTVLSDLENSGYEIQSFIIPACAVDAPHRRDRVWIVADNSRLQQRRKEQRTKRERIGQGCESIDVAHSRCPNGKTCNSDQMGNGKQGPRLQTPLPSCSKSNTYTNSAGLQKRQGKDSKGKGKDSGAQSIRITKWLPEPNVGRVAHGIPNRVDRLKSLGNAIVPQVVVPIMEAIKQIEST
jgi:DNA (cytosine-5)-methyltransferase 1